eukprot:GFUD01030766.1.p1 GENE.GFUD01030766.1~~GFUD01030766.1.p1  ORF type:complete len:630 (+),score=122.79 GFUD01030766.1:103-1992(+)
MALKVTPSPKTEKIPPQPQNGDNNYRDKVRVREKDFDQGELVLDRIYVGGLDNHIADRDLFYFFSEFGAVRHVGIIVERGYSRGYGFVTFTCKEVVRRLLEGGEGNNLVLKGRRLRLGAARQRYDHTVWNRGQGWRRHEEPYSLDRAPVGEDPTKFSPESTAIDQASGNSPHPVDSQQVSNEHHLADPNNYSYYDSSLQSPYFSQSNPPVYPYSVPSHPVYYPQFQRVEYPQNSAFMPMSIPTSDMTWYPTAAYQDTTQIPDAGTTTSPALMASNTIYPVAQSSLEGSYTMVAQPDQFTSTSSPYWPQSPMYPVYYNYGQPTMVQYSYSGETLTYPFQPVPGYQDLALGLQGSAAYQDYSNATLAIEHQNDASSYPTGNSSGFTDAPDNSGSGYADAPQLSDSGFQDSTGGLLDRSGLSQDQSSYQYQTLATELHPVDTPRQGKGYLGMNAENRSTKNKMNSTDSPHTTGQDKSPPNSDQEQQNFTKLKPADCSRTEAGRNSGNQPTCTPAGKYSRFYPTPYKSFVPYTGNPSPRHFPFPSGPRPYYSGQGRGRGRIWGHNSGSGGKGQRDVNRPVILKKKQGKKSIVGERKVGDVAEEVVADNVGGEVGMTGNQPDILQGPLQNLEIK